MVQFPFSFWGIGRQEITQLTFPAGSSAVIPDGLITDPQETDLTVDSGGNYTQGHVLNTQITLGNGSSMTPGQGVRYAFYLFSDDFDRVGQSAWFYFYDPTVSAYYYLWVNQAGGGVDPHPGFATYGIRMDIPASGNQTPDLGDAIISALEGAGFTSSNNHNYPDWYCQSSGTPDVGIGAGFESEVFDGSSGGSECPYFVVEGVAIYYVINGGGGPISGYVTQVPVYINSGDSADDVATATASAMAGSYWSTAVSSTNFVTFDNGLFGSGLPFDGTNPTHFSFDENITEVYPPNVVFAGTYGASFHLQLDGTPVNYTPIYVDISSSDDATAVGMAITTAINNAGGSYSASDLSPGVVRFTYSQNESGSAQATTLTNMASSSYVVQTTPGLSPYWTFRDPVLGNFYVWYFIDSQGSDPGVSASTGIQVTINSTDNADTVTSATKTAIQNAGYGFIVSSDGNVMVLKNPNKGGATDAADQGSFSSGFGIVVTQQGR